MFGLVVTLLVSWVGAAVVGTVTGWFWLVLVALVGLLLTGAVGVSNRMSLDDEDQAALFLAEEDVSPAGRSSHLRSVPVQRPDRQLGRSSGATASRRAA